MEEKTRYLEAKKQCSILGWSLLVYFKILNELVMLAYICDAVAYGVISGFRAAGQGMEPDFDSIITVMTDRMMTNFWGYLFAIAIGMLILFSWKGKEFWRQEIWKKERPVTVGNFLCMVVFLVATQAVVQVLVPVQEWILNQFGLSAMAALENATITGDSFSMLLYASFLGPFAEEILFRGLILRSLQKYGKQTAIFISALLFGLFHGNVVQIPYAFLVGLLLAYVTVEYSITWAIVLHVFNNFVLADLFSRLTEQLPAHVGDGIFAVLVWSCTIAAVVIGICRRKEISAYLKAHPFDNTAMRGFIAAPGIWVFTVLMLGMSTILLFA